MKQGLHPEYGPARIVCACGNVIETRATKKEMRVEVCSNCHPFYTGSRQMVVEKGGRIDRFKKKYNL
ncbi:MAG: 50S ribosomal protein L31 [Clostridia bacterium]|nr:MAG: 50S ribosomal protein L31 [Clostridia bacterium]